MCRHAAVSFQTRSMGASCGLYGGRNSRVRTARYVRSKGLSRTAWWDRVLSSTSTMRVLRERCRRSIFRKVSNVAVLNVAHRERMNLPVRKLTAPNRPLTCGCVAQNRILDFWRHPHATPGTILLEVAFEFNAPAACQAVQFF